MFIEQWFSLLYGEGYRLCETLEDEIIKSVDFMEEYGKAIRNECEINKNPGIMV